MLTNYISFDNKVFSVSDGEVFFVLGAMDPEMDYIRWTILEIGGDFAEVTIKGEKIKPFQAYHAERFDLVEIPKTTKLVVSIENGYRWSDGPTMVIDHHRPGDPGYGFHPSEFWKGSSLGQLHTALGIQKEKLSLIVAAADHCLAAAYRGECPGVNPDDLMAWRVESRAKFQKIPVEELLKRINTAREKLLCAPEVPGWPGIRDMRRPDPVPELPEAAAREGIAFISGPLKDVRNPNREKYGLMNATPEQIRAFLEGKVIHGLVDLYGDPERGFAGGYKVVS